MSNRRRAGRRPRSYAARLPRRTDPRAPRRRPTWPGLWRAPWAVVVPAVAAEAGHLLAAYVEWPESTTRGIYHVLAGALLGLVAATVRAGSTGPALVAGAAVAFSGPVLWFAGALAGASPYAGTPAPVAAAVAACEVALTAMLAAMLGAARLTGSRSPDAGKADTARRLSTTPR